MVALNFTAFVLILVRVTSMFITTPLLSIKGIPNTLKIMFCIVLSYIMYFSVAPTDVLVEIGTPMLVVLLIKEALVGLFIGMLVNIIFMSIQMAGQFIDMQGGLASAALLEPNSKNSLSIYGRIYFNLALVLYFIFNGHHYLIIGLEKSFEIINIYDYTVNFAGLIDAVDIVNQSFVIAVQIAAPMLLVFVISDLVLGIMSRTVPSLNVLILGMPLKVLAGILTFIVISPIIIKLISGVLDIIPDSMENIIKFMS
ncbi:flagellar biosynthetic protein FliR [Clostridium sp. DL1XJH146]